MFNKQLIVNLSSKSIVEESIAEETLQNYLGGRGLGVKIFIDRVSLPKLDALSPENQLVFTVGPVTGTSVPTSGRFSLVTKSPLTNTIFYSNTGGVVGVFFKKCGYDALVIDGTLDKPGYLVIDGNSKENGTEGTVTSQIKSATELWGLDTRQTLEKLKQIEGSGSHMLMIGQAGENQVHFASIMNDGNYRAFGRGGVGAVMGSKNLKAIVFKNGKEKPEIHNQDLLKKFVKSGLEKLKIAPITNISLNRFGTAGLVNIINELGMLPINNFQEGFSEEAMNISGEKIREEIFEKAEGCYACPIRCGRLTKTKQMSGKGPEYESVVLLGSACGIFDLEIITEANYLCNLYGLDTITAGATIACTMELIQRGILKDNSDLNIKFGNKDCLKPLITNIAFKKDIGEELALGSKLLAEKYNYPEAAMQVKGLELPAYDPRGSYGHALGYATSNRGGCHLTGYLAAMELFAAPKKIPRFSTGGKADLLILKQNQSVIEDSLIVCKFAGWALSFEFYSRFASTITGLEISVKDLMKIGERVYNLERLYNLREGLTSEDDTLPKRFLEEVMDTGFSKNKTVPLKQMLINYYSARGWDQNGIPTIDRLKKLDLQPITALVENNPDAKILEEN
ncbi:MAG: aldehyde ferredoxin oxidoreductase family protein [Promethearchaeota archaeon]